MPRNVNIIVLCFFVIQINGQYEGDICDNNGVEGVCRSIRSCASAIVEIQNKRKPSLCSFSNTDPIVCCVDVAPQQQQTTTTVPVLTTNRISTTTEYIPPEEDYVINDKDALDQNQCEPIAANLTAPKTGQKAWDRCIEYQHMLILPCVKGVTLTGSLSRSTKCHHDANQLVVGGVDTTKDEFPHMLAGLIVIDLTSASLVARPNSLAFFLWGHIKDLVYSRKINSKEEVLLGYGENVNSLQWLCGGSLISERFILTAGHCTSARDAGLVSHVRVGALRRTDQLTPAQLYAVSDIIKHPQYNSPQQNYDIALLKVERDVILDEFTVPACLDVGAPGDYSRVLATGWGATQNRGGNADHLQKVIINKFTTLECSKMFPPSRLLKEGFDVNTQLCYGDKNMSRDTCQGDSGGPIQLKSELLHCMYTVVGVTSFGRACGFIGEPGIYTRVAEFVPWIESLVWP